MSIVRGGYGVYYDQPLVGIFEENAFTNPPYVSTVASECVAGQPVGGHHAGDRRPASLIATSIPFKTPADAAVEHRYQRQMYRRGSIDVGYVGSHGDHLIQPVDINQPQPQDVVANGGNINAARPYRGYTAIVRRQTTARSNYSGHAVAVPPRRGPRRHVHANYTLSRRRDHVDERP